jgi:hypothetical protein
MALGTSFGSGFGKIGRCTTSVTKAEVSHDFIDAVIAVRDRA